MRRNLTRWRAQQCCKIAVKTGSRRWRSYSELKKTLNTYEQQCPNPAWKDCAVWAHLRENTSEGWILLTASWARLSDGHVLSASLTSCFASRVCWQPPLGAQTFNSVFCHGLSSFCYTWVTTSSLVTLFSMVTWGLILLFLLSFNIQSVTTFPTPFLHTWGSYLLETPALTQPRSQFLHLSSTAAFTRSVCLCRGASGWARRVA